METKKIIRKIGTLILLSFAVAMVTQMIAPEETEKSLVIHQIILTGLFYPAVH